MDWVTMETKLIIKQLGAASAFALCFAALPAWADSIDPPEYSAELGLGESVTIEKTVTISEGGPTDALIDVHFLIDTSGSMGSEVNAAKAAATDLFNELNSTFGDVHASVGVFSEAANLVDPGGRDNAVVVFGDGLTGDVTTFTNEVNEVALGVPDGGGDRPESGFTAVALAGGALDWREGSTRFMFIFTDADGKGDSAGALAAIAEDDINLVALAYRGRDSLVADYATTLGAELFSATTSAEGIIDDVTDGILAGFANYDEVTVSDLGAGMPEIDVSVVCTGADIGMCSGDTAIGDYDRSIER
ncbi:MAG: vWA domain-containing protein, partial [Pseudomonadota bacterium]